MKRKRSKIEKFFNTIPHTIKKCFIDRAEGLNVPEKNLLLHLRMMADKFGRVYVSADELRRDVFSNRVERGTVNDHLLSLRKQGHLTYAQRKGSGSPFEIALDEWLGEGGVWQTIHEDQTANNTGGSTGTTNGSKKEADSVSDEQKRRSNGLNHIDLSSYCEMFERTLAGGSYTETDMEIETTYDRSLVKLKVTKSADFSPESRIDDRLQRIALSIGEEYMGFVFYIYAKKREEGVDVMERVAMDLVDRPGVESRPRYFNSEVRRLLGLHGDIGKAAQ